MVYPLSVPVVEPILTEEKLKQLLGEQHESESLEFKRTCDLTDRHQLLDRSVDIAAMQGRGGFLVLGSDERGVLTGEMTEQQTRMFDEASLRAQISRFLIEPLDLRTAVHNIDGHRVVLVYVGASPFGIGIMRADGQYEATQGSERTKTVFRSGDAFVRRGTASVRVQQTDWIEALDRVVARRREEWRAELAAERASAPHALGWDLDVDSFVALVRQQLRDGDQGSFRLLLAGAGLVLQRRLVAGDREGVAAVLDRIVSVAAVGLVIGDDDLFDLAISALFEAFDIAPDNDSPTRISREAVAWHRLQIVVRAMALGALALRRSAWSRASQIALHASRDSALRGSWLRQGLTEGARAGLLNEQDNKKVELSLISLAGVVVRALPLLRPDLEADATRVTDSLCQFDAAACLAFLNQGGGSVYPSFAASTRTGRSRSFAG